MEEHHRIAGTEVVLYSPAHGVGAFVGQIDGDCDSAGRGIGEGGEEDTRRLGQVTNRGSRSWRLHGWRRRGEVWGGLVVLHGGES